MLNGEVNTVISFVLEMAESHGCTQSATHTLGRLYEEAALAR